MSRRATIGLVVLFALLPAPAPAGPEASPISPSWCERTTKGYRCTYGPVEVSEGNSVRILSGMAAPSEAGYITRARATLVTAEREPIPHHMVHLHHAVWLNPNKRDMTCDSFDSFIPNYDRFFATGKERTPFELPPGYGYYWSNEVPQPHTQSAPWWGINAHLDGMHGSSEIYIELDMTFVPEALAPQGMVDVRPVWLDVENCSSDPVFDVRRRSGKNGRFVKHWRYEMPEGGRFVFLGGHLHDGGLKIRLTNTTLGSSIFTSRALYERRSDPWYLTRMTTTTTAEGLPIEPGDVVRLSAVYDSTHRWRDVMGIMVGALAPAT